MARQSDLRHPDAGKVSSGWGKGFGADAGVIVTGELAAGVIGNTHARNLANRNLVESRLSGRGTGTRSSPPECLNQPGQPLLDGAFGRRLVAVKGRLGRRFPASRSTRLGFAYPAAKARSIEETLNTSLAGGASSPSAMLEQDAQTFEFLERRFPEDEIVSAQPMQMVGIMGLALYPFN